MLGSLLSTLSAGWLANSSSFLRWTQHEGLVAQDIEIQPDKLDSLLGQYIFPLSVTECGVKAVHFGFALKRWMFSIKLQEPRLHLKLLAPEGKDERWLIPPLYERVIVRQALDVLSSMIPGAPTSFMGNLVSRLIQPLLRLAPQVSVEVERCKLQLGIDSAPDMVAFTTERVQVELQRGSTLSTLSSLECHLDVAAAEVAGQTSFSMPNLRVFCDPESLDVTIPRQIFLGVTSASIGALFELYFGVIDTLDSLEMYKRRAWLYCIRRKPAEGRTGLDLWKSFRESYMLISIHQREAVQRRAAKLLPPEWMSSEPPLRQELMSLMSMEERLDLAAEVLVAHDFLERELAGLVDQRFGLFKDTQKPFEDVLRTTLTAFVAKYSDVTNQDRRLIKALMLLSVNDIMSLLIKIIKAQKEMFQDALDSYNEEAHESLVNETFEDVIEDVDPPPSFIKQNTKIEILLPSVLVNAELNLFSLKLELTLLSFDQKPSSKTSVVSIGSLQGEVYKRKPTLHTLGWHERVLWFMVRDTSASLESYTPTTTGPMAESTTPKLTLTLDVRRVVGCLNAVKLYEAVVEADENPFLIKVPPHLHHSLTHTLDFFESQLSAYESVGTTTHVEAKIPKIELAVLLDATIHACDPSPIVGRSFSFAMPKLGEATEEDISELEDNRRLSAVTLALRGRTGHVPPVLMLSASVKGDYSHNTAVTQQDEIPQGQRRNLAQGFTDVKALLKGDSGFWYPPLPRILSSNSPLAPDVRETDDSEPPVPVNVGIKEVNFQDVLDAMSQCVRTRGKKDGMTPQGVTATPISAPGFVKWIACDLKMLTEVTLKNCIDIIPNRMGRGMSCSIYLGSDTNRKHWLDAYVLTSIKTWLKDDFLVTLNFNDLVSLVKHMQTSSSLDSASKSPLTGTPAPSPRTKDRTVKTKVVQKDNIIQKLPTRVLTRQLNWLTVLKSGGVLFKATEASHTIHVQWDSVSVNLVSLPVPFSGRSPSPLDPLAPLERCRTVSVSLMKCHTSLMATEDFSLLSLDFKLADFLLSTWFEDARFIVLRCAQPHPSLPPWWKDYQSYRSLACEDCDVKIRNIEHVWELERPVDLNGTFMQDEKEIDFFDTSVIYRSPTSAELILERERQLFPRVRIKLKMGRALEAFWDKATMVSLLTCMDAFKNTVYESSFKDEVEALKYSWPFKVLETEYQLDEKAFVTPSILPATAPLYAQISLEISRPIRCWFFDSGWLSFVCQLHQVTAEVETPLDEGPTVLAGSVKDLVCVDVRRSQDSRVLLGPVAESGCSVYFDINVCRATRLTQEGECLEPGTIIDVRLSPCHVAFVLQDILALWTCFSAQVLDAVLVAPEMRLPYNLTPKDLSLFVTRFKHSELAPQLFLSAKSLRDARILKAILDLLEDPMMIFTELEDVQHFIEAFINGLACAGGLYDSSVIEKWTFQSWLGKLQAPNLISKTKCTASLHGLVASIPGEIKHVLIGSQAPHYRLEIKSLLVSNYSDYLRFSLLSPNFDWNILPLEEGPTLKPSMYQNNPLLSNETSRWPFQSSTCDFTPFRPLLQSVYDSDEGWRLKTEMCYDSIKPYLDLSFDTHIGIYDTFWFVFRNMDLRFIPAKGGTESGLGLTELDLAAYVMIDHNTIKRRLPDPLMLAAYVWRRLGADNPVKLHMDPSSLETLLHLLFQNIMGDPSAPRPKDKTPASLPLSMGIEDDHPVILIKVAIEPVNVQLRPLHGVVDEYVDIIIQDIELSVDLWHLGGMLLTVDLVQTTFSLAPTQYATFKALELAYVSLPSNLNRQLELGSQVTHTHPLRAKRFVPPGIKLQKNLIYQEMKVLPHNITAMLLKGEDIYTHFSLQSLMKLPDFLETYIASVLKGMEPAETFNDYTESVEIPPSVASVSSILTVETTLNGIQNQVEGVLETSSLDLMADMSSITKNKGGETFTVMLADVDLPPLSVTPHQHTVKLSLPGVALTYKENHTKRMVLITVQSHCFLLSKSLVEGLLSVVTQAQKALTEGGSLRKDTQGSTQADTQATHPDIKADIQFTHPDIQVTHPDTQVTRPTTPHSDTLPERETEIEFLTTGQMTILVPRELLSQSCSITSWSPFASINVAPIRALTRMTRLTRVSVALGSLTVSLWNPLALTHQPVIETTESQLKVQLSSEPNMCPLTVSYNMDKRAPMLLTVTPTVISYALDCVAHQAQLIGVRNLTLHVLSITLQLQSLKTWALKAEGLKTNTITLQPAESGSLYVMESDEEALMDLMLSDEIGYMVYLEVWSRGDNKALGVSHFNAHQILTQRQTRHQIFVDGGVVVAGCRVNPVELIFASYDLLVCNLLPFTLPIKFGDELMELEPDKEWVVPVSDPRNQIEIAGVELNHLVKSLLDTDLCTQLSQGNIYFTVYTESEELQPGMNQSKLKFVQPITVQSHLPFAVEFHISSQFGQDQSDINPNQSWKAGVCITDPLEFGLRVHDIRGSTVFSLPPPDAHAEETLTLSLYDSFGDEDCQLPFLIMLTLAYKTKKGVIIDLQIGLTIPYILIVSTLPSFYLHRTGPPTAKQICRLEVSNMSECVLDFPESCVPSIVDFTAFSLSKDECRHYEMSITLPEEEGSELIDITKLTKLKVGELLSPICRCSREGVYVVSPVVQLINMCPYVSFIDEDDAVELHNNGGYRTVAHSSLNKRRDVRPFHLKPKFCNTTDTSQQHSQVLTTIYLGNQKFGQPITSLVSSYPLPTCDTPPLFTPRLFLIRWMWIGGAYTCVIYDWKPVGAMLPCGINASSVEGSFGIDLVSRETQEVISLETSPSITTVPLVPITQDPDDTLIILKLISGPYINLQVSLINQCNYTLVPSSNPVFDFSAPTVECVDDYGNVLVHSIVLKQQDVSLVSSLASDSLSTADVSKVSKKDYLRYLQSLLQMGHPSGTLKLHMASLSLAVAVGDPLVDILNIEADASTLDVVFDDEDVIAYYTMGHTIVTQQNVGLQHKPFFDQLLGIKAGTKLVGVVSPPSGKRPLVLKMCHLAPAPFSVHIDLKAVDLIILCFEQLVPLFKTDEAPAPPSHPDFREPDFPSSIVMELLDCPDALSIGGISTEVDILPLATEVFESCLLTSGQSPLLGRSIPHIKTFTKWISLLGVVRGFPIEIPSVDLVARDAAKAAPMLIPINSLFNQLVAEISVPLIRTGTSLLTHMDSLGQISNFVKTLKSEHHGLEGFAKTLLSDTIHAVGLIGLHAAQATASITDDTDRKKQLAAKLFAGAASLIERSIRTPTREDHPVSDSPAPKIISAIQQLLRK